MVSEASVAAYRNSLDLLQDAKILYANGRWSSSYFLALASAEQFARSVELACDSAGIKLKAESPRENQHDFRLRRFARLAMSRHMMAIEGWNIFARKSKGALSTKTYDHAFLGTLFRSFEGQAGKRRASSLYVEIEKGRLSTPSKAVKAEDARTMIEIVESVVSREPDFLGASGESLKSRLALAYAPFLKLGDADDARKEKDIIKFIGKFLKDNPSAVDTAAPSN